MKTGGGGKDDTKKGGFLRGKKLTVLIPYGVTGAVVSTCQALSVQPLPAFEKSARAFSKTEIDLGSDLFKGALLGTLGSDGKDS